MSNSQKISRSQTLIGALAVIAMLWVAGCGDFLGKKSTGAQVQGIISDLGGIKTAPEPNIPIPQIYKAPPKIVKQIVGGGEEWKLFYFCRHHTSTELAAVVNEQFAHKLFNEEGKSTTVADYTVSDIPSTNQLIVRCPLEQDVNAVLEFLELTDVPPIQVKIDCLISEVYADKTLDWETTIQIYDLFGEDIRLAPAGKIFGADVWKLLTEGTPLPTFPGASLRELGRGKMGLKIGYLSESHQFRVLVDLLESQGYLKILMNPTLQVVNGKKATVLKSEHVPLQKITKVVPGAGGTTVVHTQTEYIDVVDSLEITPHVYVGDGTIGLETTIILGSKLTPEGVKQLPIVTKKQIDNEENRIRQGESLIIGGIRKSEKRDVIRGVPFLKDIPILGVLFSGKDFEERVVETIFILTPTISTGGVPREEMLEEVERKHQPPSSESEDLYGAVTNPLGLKARQKQQQQKARDVEQARLEAKAEKAEARHALREAKAQAEKARAETEKARAETEKMKMMLDRLNKTLKESGLDTQKAKAEAEKAKADAEKT